MRTFPLDPHKHTLCALACGLALLCCGTDARAALPLAEYREQIQAAIEDLNLATTAAGSGQTARRDEVEMSETELLAEVREHLPVSESVEWEGGALSVDNSWLHHTLSHYEQSSGMSAENRALLLIQLTDQLRALDARLAEFAGAPTLTRDKEAEKGRLQAILRRPEYNQQAASGGAVKRFWAWLSELWHRLFPAAKPFEPGAVNSISTFARYIVYALALAVVASLLWFYGPRLWRQRHVTRKKRGQGAGARVVLGERLAPHQTGASLLAEAERLATAGEWRGAVRKAYIAVLCELGERQVISLAQHKTNRDYLTTLRHERTRLYEEMRPLTQSYEKLWYGLAPADATDWTDFRARCGQALQRA